jgi:hypothetical protein
VNHSCPGSVLSEKDRSSWPAGALTAAGQPSFPCAGLQGRAKGEHGGADNKTALALAATMTMVAALAELAAGPASAGYKPPPPFALTCPAADGTLENGVCVLPPGQTTAPNSYTATVTDNNPADKPTFAVAAGSLPPGLTMPAQSGSGTIITGNPAKAGVFNFTIKASINNATQAYEITITTQGPPDQLLCALGSNGGVLESGVCVLPDATAGLPYAGHLPTSHQGTGDQGQPLYQAYSITVDPNKPLAINASGGTDLGPGMAGGAFAQNFFLNGGAAPYTWSVATGQVPPGLSLRTFSDPRDANDELAGIPATAGTYTFTVKVSDYDGQQATQKFTLTIDPLLQISATPLPAGTVGVPYSHDLPAQGGAPPYTWSVVNTINELPPGLTLGTTAPGLNNVLTGTPTQAGTFSFPMQVQDSQDNTATGTVTITINS